MIPEVEDRAPAERSLLRRHGLPLVLLLGAWLVLLAALLLSGGVLAGGDIRRQELHFFHLLGQALSRGELPLWNPYVLCGVPHLAAMVGGALNPIHMALAPLGPELAINLAACLHLLVAAVGAYALAFHLFRSAPGGLVAAGIYALGGFSIMHLEAGHLGLLASFSLVPLLLLALERFLAGGRASDMLLVGLALGLLVLSGHPQVTLLGLAGAGLWTLCRLIRWRPNGAPTVFRGLVLLSGATLLGALLSAIQWAPALAYAARSGRAAVTDAAFHAMGAVELPALALTLAPGSLGPRAVAVPWEMSAFAGITGLALILVGVTTRGRLAPLLGALLLLVLVLALGPVNEALRRVIPALGLFRVPGRFLALATIWTMLLAALAMSRLDPRRLLLALPAVLLLAALAAMVTTGLLAGAFWLAVLPPLAAAGLLCALGLTGRLKVEQFRWAIALLVMLELVLFAGPRLRTTPTANLIHPDIARAVRADPQRRRLMAVPPMDLNSTVQARVPGISGYIPAAPDRFRRYFALATGNPENTQFVQFIPSRFSPALSHLGLGFVLTGSPGKMPDFLRPVMKRGKQTLHALTSPRPRAQLRRQFVTAPSAVEAVRMAASGKVDLKRAAVLEGTLPAAAPGQQASGPDLIRWLDHAPGNVSLEVRLERPALLLLADAFAPGWRATSNGRALPVLPVNGVLTGLNLGKGAHRIQLEYRPREVARGLALSLTGLVILMGGAIYLRVRRRRLA